MHDHRPARAPQPPSEKLFRQIGFESQLGGGTTFTVAIPAPAAR